MTPDLRSQATRTTSSRNSMGQSISTTPSLQTTLPNKPNQTSPTRTTNPTHQYCDLAEENTLSSHHAMTPQHAQKTTTDKKPDPRNTTTLDLNKHPEPDPPRYQERHPPQPQEE